MTTNYRIIALTVSTALFMQFLDSSALYTAIPVIARGLGVPAIQLDVAILAYQLAMTVLVPAGTAIAERIGPRNAFAGALLVFMTGSILCALSASLPALVAARALQGAAGAVMVPVSRLLVVRSADKSELVSAMNWLLIPGVIGPLLGPALSGLIVTYFSWHWIFLINAPVALLGLVLTMLFVPDIRAASVAPFDRKGMALAGPAIFTLMFGLLIAARPNGGWAALALVAAGTVLGLAYVRHARRVISPLLDLSLLRIGSFRHSLVAGSVIRVAAGANGFLMPLWLQLGMGMSAARTGSLLVISAVGVIFTRLISGALLRAIHPRSIAIGGSLLLGLALFMTSRLHAGLPIWVFYAVLGFQSLMVAMPLIVVTPVMYLDIESDRFGQAAGLFATLQQLSMSLGVTVGVWALAGMRWYHGASEFDSRVYSGGIAMIALIATLAVFSTIKLDAESTEALRGGKS